MRPPTFISLSAIGLVLFNVAHTIPVQNTRTSDSLAQPLQFNTILQRSEPDAVAVTNPTSPDMKGCKHTGMQTDEKITPELKKRAEKSGGDDDDDDEDDDEDDDDDNDEDDDDNDNPSTANQGSPLNLANQLLGILKKRRVIEEHTDEPESIGQNLGLLNIAHISPQPSQNTDASATEIQGAQPTGKKHRLKNHGSIDPPKSSDASETKPILSSLLSGQESTGSSKAERPERPERDDERDDEDDDEDERDDDEVDED